ncbi:hypothetical protein IFM89_036986 [Coptis chinensis]|uniref:Phosphotransferase n=1 Tax=Coptis chinensis TaxID=261450 RepID=A0A835HBA3_9MAGN|nr:hypothetical protein IFM89_036986 [Coptis chinensis]
MGKLGFGIAVSCAVVTCAIAVVFVSRRVKSRRKWNRVVGVLKELEEGCSTSIGRLRQVVDAMAVEMHAGLASDGGRPRYHNVVDVKFDQNIAAIELLCFSSFLILNSPAENFFLIFRNEKGTYYALDLGGTNFRVLRVQLGGKSSKILGQEVERQPIPQHLMTSTSEELFDFIGLTLKQFVERENNTQLQLDMKRELGFTFSFPVRQITASSGILIKWTKGFSIEDMVGKDVSDCLQQALTKRGLNIQVAALVNDTVGTLALGHYHDEDTVAAVIIGTGTNACYVERTEAIIKSQGLHTNSGGMGFEKMISGMYLGDIVRRVILRMAQESDIFVGVASRLSVPFILRCFAVAAGLFIISLFMNSGHEHISLIAAMHEDDSPDLREVARILRDTLQMCDVPLKARKLIVRVCDVVTRRAARLAAAGIVGILKKIGRDGNSGITGGRSKSGGESTNKMRRTVVAVEGGLFASYTMFREYLNEGVSEILGDEIAPFVVLKASEDGSGIGAALLAASHSSSDVDNVRLL